MQVISDRFKEILKLKNDITLVSFLSFTFSFARRSPVTYGFTTAPRNTVRNGRTFDSDHVINITPPKVFGTVTRDVYDLDLSADLISLSPGSFFSRLQGQPNGAVIGLTVYVLDPDTFEYEDNLFLRYGGFTSGWNIDGSIIRIRSTGDLTKLGAVQSRTSTSAFQQSRFPGKARFENDTGFDQVGDTEDILKQWGG